MEKAITEYAKLYGEKESSIMKIAEDSLDPGLARIDEIILFAREAGMQKIGIANCIAFQKEATQLEEYLKENGFSIIRANCKLGRVPFSEIVPGYKGIACNPAGQAEIMNTAETDLNIVMGLCLGHDSIFTQNSKALATTLVVKDRKYKHNTLASLSDKDLFNNGASKP